MRAMHTASMVQPSLTLLYLSIMRPESGLMIRKFLASAATNEMYGHLLRHLFFIDLTSVVMVIEEPSRTSGGRTITWP